MTRQVVLSTSPTPKPDCTFLLYCSDGQAALSFAQAYYRQSGATDVVFVGVECDAERRNQEYVIGRDEELFRRHEAFFTQSVPEQLSKEHGINALPERTGVFGYSCGGAFAFAMGIRHPGLFRHAFCFSIAGRPITDFDVTAESLDRSHFYLAAGTREPIGMKKYMGRLAKWLASQEASVTIRVEPGGHDIGLWINELNHYLAVAIYSE